MANSDNVLRGGLTSKHIDVPELLRVLKFTESEVTIIRPKESESGERVYSTPFREFLLSSLSLKKERPYTGRQERSIEIWIITDGEVRITGLSGGKELRAKKGQSFLIPASLGC
jgi:mannose-6-phosphate isomerase